MPFFIFFHFFFFLNLHYKRRLSFTFFFSFASDWQSVFSVTVGIASETLNDWADEEAGLEAVQRVLDSLDDIHALQDPYVDPDVLHSMLKDIKLHALLQVSVYTFPFVF